MTRILFYVLDSTAPQARDHFVCRLVQKAFARGHRIHIHTGDAQKTKALDELLWTFEDDSFLPHAASVEAAGMPITLHESRLPEAHDDLLINLADVIPDGFGRFAQVADVVGGDESSRAAGRERFRFFRERGYPIDHHRIGK